MLHFLEVKSAAAMKQPEPLHLHGRADKLSAAPPQRLEVGNQGKGMERKPVCWWHILACLEAIVHFRESLIYPKHNCC